MLEFLTFTEKVGFTRCKFSYSHLPYKEKEKAKKTNFYFFSVPFSKITLYDACYILSREKITSYQKLHREKWKNYIERNCYILSKIVLHPIKSCYILSKITPRQFFFHVSRCNFSKPQAKRRRLFQNRQNYGFSAKIIKNKKKYKNTSPPKFSCYILSRITSYRVKKITSYRVGKFSFITCYTERNGAATSYPELHPIRAY